MNLDDEEDVFNRREGLRPGERGVSDCSVVGPFQIDPLPIVPNTCDRRERIRYDTLYRKFSTSIRSDPVEVIFVYKGYRPAKEKTHTWSPSQRPSLWAVRKTIDIKSGEGTDLVHGDLLCHRPKSYLDHHFFLTTRDYALPGAEAFGKALRRDLNGVYTRRQSD